MANDKDSQNVVITGASRGIGLALVSEYLRRGAQVFALCRTATEALAASGATVLEQVDVGDPARVAALPERLAGVRIDLLINNAGILESGGLDNLDFDAVERQLSINAVAPLRVTRALLPLMGKGARVGLVTSRMGSITDNGSGGYYGYRMSKAALNAAGMSLARDLAPRGISVALLHPGFVQTDMVGGAGDISADTAAHRLAERLDGLNVGNTGTFWHSSGEVLPW